ncbi:MAG TPA: hypothetical protein VG144_11360 [Gaiellaceae bacterium]|nr:hypothetical protein [Gaiellaceae bacterium]
MEDPFEGIEGIDKVANPFGRVGVVGLELVCKLQVARDLISEPVAPL